jgi:hypothetical protein
MCSLGQVDGWWMEKDLRRSTTEVQDDIWSY